MNSKRKKVNIPPGHNADRKKCDICQYRSAGNNGKNGCDFIEFAKRSRGCKVDDCDKFIEGPRLILKESDLAEFFLT